MGLRRNLRRYVMDTAFGAFLGVVGVSFIGLLAGVYTIDALLKLADRPKTNKENKDE